MGNKFRGKKFFENLRPFGAAIAGAIRRNEMPDELRPTGGLSHGLDAPSLEDRLQKAEDKRLRRIAAARRGGFLMQDHPDGDGPGVEDGPWADGWEERNGERPSEA
jgi:hypothetical protein